jgi:hypothetical protein
MLYSARVDFSAQALLIWSVAILLEMVVFALALRRDLHRRLPLFTVYLFLLIANEVIAVSVYTVAGFTSHTSFVVAWSLQALLLSARALVVYEICRNLLWRRLGVWRVYRPILIGAGVVLVCTAALASWQSVHFSEEFVVTAGRSLELGIVGVLILALLLCCYYRIGIERHVTWIALGFGFYSAVQIANNTFLQNWAEFFHLWNILRNGSFDIAVALWIIALRRPLPAVQPLPVLLGRGEYEKFSPVVTARFRELNTRLLRMWK